MVSAPTRHHHLHRRHCVAARLGELRRVCRRQACAARAGAKHGARTGPDGHPRRAQHHRRRDRHRLHPRQFPRSLRAQRRKTASSTPTTLPTRTGCCTPSRATRGLTSWTCVPTWRNSDEKFRVLVRLRQPGLLSRVDANPRHGSRHRSDGRASNRCCWAACSRPRAIIRRPPFPRRANTRSSTSHVMQNAMACRSITIRISRSTHLH